MIQTPERRELEMKGHGKQSTYLEGSVSTLQEGGFDSIITVIIIADVAHDDASPEASSSRRCQTGFACSSSSRSSQRTAPQSPCHAGCARSSRAARIFQMKGTL